MFITAFLFASALDQALAYPAQPQRFQERNSAYVQGTLNLVFSERAVLRLRDDGNYDLIRVDKIGVDAVEPPPADHQGPLNKAEEGTITLALHGNARLGILVKIENATGRGLKYVGYIVPVAQGRVQPIERTTVCTVPAGIVAFEHWTTPILQFVAGGLEQTDDELPRCETEESIRQNP